MGQTSCDGNIWLNYFEEEKVEVSLVKWGGRTALCPQRREALVEEGNAAADHRVGSFTDILLPALQLAKVFSQEASPLIWSKNDHQPDQHWTLILVTGEKNISLLPWLNNRSLEGRQSHQFVPEMVVLRKGWSSLTTLRLGFLYHPSSSLFIDCSSEAFIIATALY